MKNCIILFVLALAGMSGNVGAAEFDYTVGAIITDGDLSGYQNSQTITGGSGGITDLNVTLNILGGFNGDFYASLTHNGTTAILLNRVGRTGTHNAGYPDAGFGPDASSNSFTLDDQAAQDVHFYRNAPYGLNSSGQLTGQWQPDARNLDPLSPTSAFDGAPRSGLLSLFNGEDPSGVWTLYIADVSPGGEGTLVSWGLQITAVPEPSVVAVACAALLLLSRSRRAGADGRRALGLKLEL